jgi:hypothetical protein
VSETRLVSQSDLYALSLALELNASHCAKAYEREAPAIVVIGDTGKRLSKLPPECFPVLFVEDDGANGQTLGEHWFEYDKQIPVARVIVNNTSGLNTGSNSVSETASHEVLEAMCNPMLAGWYPHPTRTGVEVAYENCDPRQDHYEVEVKGTRWKMSNFVTPQWFMRAYVNNPAAVRYLIETEGYGLDWLKRCQVPGEVGSEGYMVLRRRLDDGSYETWSEDFFGQLDASRMSEAKRTSLRHQFSRSRKLGVRA